MAVPPLVRDALGPHHTKWFAAGLCAYEVAAICTGKFPTLTELSGRHRVLAPALVALLAVHLYWHPYERR